MSEAIGSPETPPVIVEGYRPGLIGQVVSLHAETYSRWAGFGSAFESKVAMELGEFVTRLDRPANAIWHVAQNDRILGNIAIDGEDLGDGRAHLRWFIVDPACRGAGLGRRLLDRAMEFADRRQAAETRLWTLKGLEAARALYETAGFVLADEYDGESWGTRITEQIFVRRSPVSR